MTWLLRLYPSPWRRRYGGEVADMLADRRFSLRIAVDLIAGAIDVWLHPDVTMAAASAAELRPEEKTMTTPIAGFDCSRAFGPNLTKADQWKASTLMIGCTLLLTGLWVEAHIRLGDNPYVDSLSILPFMVGMLVSMRYTYLKGRPNSVQIVFIGGITLILAVFFLGAGWLATKI